MDFEARIGGLHPCFDGETYDSGGIRGCLGAWRVGDVLIVDGLRDTAHTHVPEWFMCAGAGIFELELLAEILGLMLECEIAPGRPLLLCFDNSGAAATVVRGSRRTVLGKVIASVFGPQRHVSASLCGLKVWSRC